MPVEKSSSSSKLSGQGSGPPPGKRLKMSPKRVQEKKAPVSAEKKKDSGKVDKDYVASTSREKSPKSAKNLDQKATICERLFQDKDVTNKEGSCVNYEIFFKSRRRTQEMLKTWNLVSTVCRLFRTAAKVPELWKCVDFDTGKIKLDHKKDVMRKVSREFISPVATKYLSFANMRSLKYVELMEVLSKTPALKGLNLAFCHGLKPQLIFTGEIKEKCPELQSLDLSYILKSSNKPGFSKMSSEFLTTHSKGLLYFYLNGVYIYDITKILNAASSWNNHGLWTKLEECNISPPTGELQDQNDFMRFLSGCMSLRRLNAFGVSGAFHSLVKWKNGCRLTHLVLSKSTLLTPISNVFTYNRFTVKEPFGEVRFEVECEGAVDLMLRSLADRGGMEERPLRKLDLEGTPVETGELKKVLEACVNLSWINLTDCEFRCEFPLREKRVHGSREEVEELANVFRKI